MMPGTRSLTVLPRTLPYSLTTPWLFPDGLPDGLDWDALRELFAGRDLDEVSPDDLGYPSRDEIRARLASLAGIVRDGEEAKLRRAAVMRLARAADRDYWTQERLADAGAVTQAAVSKALAGAPRPPASSQMPYLIGRLVAVAEAAAGNLDRGAGRLAGKMLTGRWPVTPASIGILSQLMEHDLAQRSRHCLPGTPLLRETAAEITAALASLDAAVPATLDNQAGIFAGYDAQRRELTPAVRRRRSGTQTTQTPLRCRAPSVDSAPVCLRHPFCRRLILRGDQLAPLSCNVSA
jgi:hypothetical protein